MLSFIHLFVFLIFSISLSSSGDLPSYFPKCHRSDPEFQKCLLKATETVRPYIKKGVPELDIPPIEPLYIPEIILEQGTSAVNYKLNLTNATITGMGNYVFKEYIFDPKTLNFHGTTFFKGLTLVSDYIVDGRILLAPISGSGTLTIKLGPSTGSLSIKGELIKRGNEEYYNIVNTKSTIKVTNSTTHFDGLFNGNKELEDATNRLFNENSDELAKEIGPAIEEVASSLIKRMMRGLCNKVPYNKMIPL